jgi:hypothetical protein
VPRSRQPLTLALHGGRLIEQWPGCCAVTEAAFENDLREIAQSLIQCDFPQLQTTAFRCSNGIPRRIFL